jgi:hypothetical protein
LLRELSFHLNLFFFSVLAVNRGSPATLEKEEGLYLEVEDLQSALPETMS